LGASVEDMGVTLVMLLSEVANNYIQLRTFETRLDFARKNVELQTGTAQIARNRFKNGVSTELDLRQAESNLAQTQTLIPPLVTGRRQASNRLCVLLGMPVDDLANRLSPAPIPKPPLQVAVGIPADLIRRRPDIRRAERLVAAQSARIGIAASDLYPRFFINGFVGYAATDFKDLFAAKSFTGVALPAFQWNLLNYGRITNNIRVQDARLQQAVLQYQQTVLTGGREVEDALIAFLQAQEQAIWAEVSVDKAQRSVELVINQFEGGTTDFNRVFNTQSLLVTQQDQLASVKGNIATSLVDLYRALGGGWRCFLAGQGVGNTLHLPSVPLDAGNPASPETPQPPAEKLPVPQTTPEK
jgi:NodT family efflux transporter outer membrane factor (OMF) lipoprotein